MTTSETVVFNGVKFYRYPDSSRASDRMYFRPGIADRQRGVQALHQEVWRDANGGAPIPPGFHVHHKDRDPLNNDPSNLVLISEADHHAEHREEKVARGRANPPSPAAHEAAAAWHRSEEGRAWHREHGARTWEGREAENRVCAQCNAVFQTLDRKKATRFCSNKCKAAARRASGVDDERRACVVCGAEFTVNRYSKVRTCSRKCGAASRADRRWRAAGNVPTQPR